MARFCFLLRLLAVLVTASFLTLCASAQTKVALDRPELALQLGHSLPIIALAYSPDGRLLVSGSADNSVKIWDAQSRELIRTLEGHLAPVRGVAFSPDGKTLATGDEDGSITFWNPRTGARIRHMARLILGVRGLAYSPDGKYFSAACGIRGSGPTRDARGQWVLWDARTWEVLHKPIFSDALVSVAFTPRGNHLALGSLDRSITIVDAATGATRGAMRIKNGFPNAIAFSHDGSTLAATNNNRVELWDAPSGAPLRTLSDANITTIFSLAFAPDGSTLATASMDKATDKTIYHTRLWDTQSGQVRQNFREASLAYALAFSPDKSTLASGVAGSVRLRDVTTGDKRAGEAFAVRQRWVRALAWSRDGKLVAGAGGNGEVLMWDAQTGALRRALRDPKNDAPIATLSFSPDGNTLATGNGGAEVVLWNARSGSIARRLRGKTPALNALAWSPDGKTLAAGAASVFQKGAQPREEIQLWSTRTGELSQTWQGRPGFVGALVYSPDGKVLAVAQSGAPWRTGKPGENAVTLRDARSGRVLATLLGHADFISSVAFSPDGKFIASAGKDKSVRLWDARTKRLVRTMSGHTDWVQSVAFSTDGNTLVSSGRDNTLRLWGATTGKTLRILRGHEGDVLAAAWSPDGKLLASGGTDTTLRLWSASDGRELLRMLVAAHPEASTQDAAPGASTPEPPLWLAATPEGYYDCAEGADYLVKWRMGGKLLPFYHFEETYRRPDLLRRVLRGQRIAARPLLITRVPPAIRLLALANIPNTPGRLRVLIEAADDSELHNSNFQFYVNGVLIPDQTARPNVVEGKPIIVDGKPVSVNGKPVVINGKPIIVDGKPIIVDGKPIIVDGKPITADGRNVPGVQKISAQNGMIAGAASDDSIAQYGFHRLYVMDVALPLEEKIVLRAVVTDNEGNKSDDGLTMQRQQIEPVKGDLFVLAIGVSSYRNPLYNISYAAADARSIAATLGAQAGQSYSHVYSTVLSDEKADVKNIHAALDKLKAAKSNDTVMVFLSGHGIAANGKTYFAPWGVFVRDLAGTCVEWREIVSRLSDLYAKKLLFTDACHSGAKLGSRQATSFQLTEAVRRESGIVMFASSQADEFSYEDKEVKQGTFSLALAEAFAGKADVDGDGNITLPELAMYVPRRVSESTKGLQNPQLVLVQDFNPQTVLAQVNTVKIQAVAAKRSAP